MNLLNATNDNRKQQYLDTSIGL